MALEEDLRRETEKWLNKIKKIKFDGDKEFVENIRAYISDTQYFLNRNDLIRAFECIVWAWAWLEIGLKIGKLRTK